MSHIIIALIIVVFVVLLWWIATRRQDPPPRTMNDADIEALRVELVSAYRRAQKLGEDIAAEILRREQCTASCATIGQCASQSAHRNRLRNLLAQVLSDIARQLRRLEYTQSVTLDLPADIRAAAMMHRGPWQGINMVQASRDFADTKIMVDVGLHGELVSQSALTQKHCANTVPQTAQADVRGAIWSPSN